MAAAAAATATEHHHLHLKLFVDPKAPRVVFAEASGKAIEFLYSWLDLPHVSPPFDGVTTNASIGNVYDSIKKLCKFADTVNDISRGTQSSTVQKKRKQEEEERFFVGGSGGGKGSCGGYVADKSSARCPFCGGEMAMEVPRSCPGASCSDAYAEPGVKGPNLTCVLYDVLTVTATGSIIPRACNFMMSFIAPGTVQEMVVCLGYTEAIEILEMSLQSSTVLTDVFLRKKKKAGKEKKARHFGKSLA